MSPSSSTRVEWARRLTQALVAGGYVREADVTPLFDEASAGGPSFTALVIGREVATPEVTLGVLSQISQLPVADLANDPPEPAAVQAVFSGVGRDYGAVGYRIDGTRLMVAFADPPDAEDVHTLSGILGYEVVPVLGDPITIERILRSGPSHGSGNGSMAGGPEAVAGNPAGANGSPTGTSVEVTAQTMPMHLDDLLRYASNVGASDLHLTAGMPGCIRLHGAIRPIEGCPQLDNETIRDMLFGVLTQSLREKFEAEKELDTSHSIPGVGRFRLNVFQQRGTVAGVLRAIPHEIPPFETLGIPESVRMFTELRQGLVLVTGPTGSGKSTTLASLIDIINRTKPLHIVTVEDPIEFLHNHKRSIVNQRELGSDTMSFAEALRRVLREDPDVILVGEMRDLDTISMALTAAETGHLVFGTLHTQDAPQTIDRIIDVFPTTQQEQVRTMLAGALEGVVTQQLVPDAEGTGRAACCEVMVCTSAIRNLVRSAKTHQIYSLMQTGSQYGMSTMDQGLSRLVKEGRITEGVALDRCHNEEDLRNHLNS
ncbi:MAG TPA: PilT/PilU family type 4a pilus ATPase [Acidimicrobiales bacterium]|nr:PilT/PilU family type 4a pilus ATPase [Acidimicrobiales bacterium]